MFGGIFAVRDDDWIVVGKSVLDVRLIEVNEVVYNPGDDQQGTRAEAALDERPANPIRRKIRAKKRSYRCSACS